MKKHVLAERTHIHIDPKSGERRIADLKKDASNVFLLGPQGAEISMEEAVVLKLVKAEKPEKAEKGEKE